MAIWIVSSVNDQISVFLYIREEIESPCLFFYLYFSIYFLLVFIRFSFKSKCPNFILIFLAPLFSLLKRDFYSIVFIVIINKPGCIPVILFCVFYLLHFFSSFEGLNESRPFYFPLRRLASCSVTSYFLYKHYV